MLKTENKAKESEFDSKLDRLTLNCYNILDLIFMKNYELTYLFSSEASEEEVKTFSEELASFIQAEGGVLNNLSSPSKKKLAYLIKKQIQAYLVNLTFQLNPDKIAILEKKLKGENEILRYLLLAKRVFKISSKPARTRSIVRKPREALPKKEKKVELKEIEKKLEEILE